MHSNALQEAIGYSIEGPLHKAVDLLRTLLDSGNSAAGPYLADVLARLGRYDEALGVLDGMRGEHSWDSRYQEQWERTHRALNDLEFVERSRYCRAGFLEKAVVPDGRGSYLVDTLGFPGTWLFSSKAGKYISPPACLRLLKSVAWISEETRAGRVTPRAMSEGLIECKGSVSIVPSSDLSSLKVAFEKQSDGSLHWFFEADPKVLNWEREQQRAALREALEKEEIAVLKAPVRAEETEGTSSRELPRVMLISPGLASDYAVAVLRDRLISEGFRADAAYIRSMKLLDRYLEWFASPSDSGDKPPDVFAVSVLDAEIESVCYMIANLRRAFPDSRIIIGGASSQTPEQLASVVPDFDVMIRGDADEALARVAAILGCTPRRNGVSQAQLDEIKALPGGIVLQIGSHRLVHGLDYMNVPAEYHLPVPRVRKHIYYWQTSRGCPYDCRFCNKWTGRRYHTVVPWDDHGAPNSPLGRSAYAMIEFLLGRLAMEMPSGITQEEIKRRLEDGVRDGNIQGLPELPEKIFIVIEDDDFLIQRDRVIEFCRQVEELGLQQFFVFSAITSIRTVFRGGDQPDIALLHALHKAGFQSLDVGSDGLSQSTIEENQKGYSLDRHVIPLNRLAKGLGFFCFNNTIISTPYTTLPQLIESLIFYVVCPYPINTAIEIGIMGHIGNKYTNEDFVNQQYDWTDEPGKDFGHYRLIDNYRVPKDFPEYALNGSLIIGYADPKVRDLVLEFPKQRTEDFIQEKLSPEDVRSVLESWINLPDSRSETKALGLTISLLTQGLPWSKFGATLSRIKDEMSALNISSFVDYYDALSQGAVENDSFYMKTREAMGEALESKEKGDWGRAEEAFRNLTERVPWYFRPHRERMICLLQLGRYSEAVEHFAKYQLIDPNLHFYHSYFGQVLKSLGLDDAVRTQRAMFHIPRYFTISPIFYYLALIMEVAGGDEVRGFAFPPVHPERIERMYDLFDYLTIDLIRGWVEPRRESLRKDLLEGREVLICGVPVRLDLNQRLLIVDYDRVSPNSMNETRSDP